MKFFRAIIGYFIAGLLVMSIWNGLVDSYGIAGGYMAAIIIIGPMYYLNHYIGLIDIPEDHAFVDMAFGIGVAGIFRDIFMNGFEAFTSTIPTLSLVIIGAIIGGIAAGFIEENMEKEQDEKHAFKPADETPGPKYDGSESNLK